MADPRHKSLDWHPEEISFLQKCEVICQTDELGALQPIKVRWIHSTLREVFIAPSGYVLKRFSHFPGRKDFRQVWRREHQALTRLEGLPVPKSLGYIKVRHAAGRHSVLHIKEFIPGRPLESPRGPIIKQIAGLLASFHDRGVVTLDPQPENFIEMLTPGSTIACIDFGRARTFRKRSPLFLFNIGKEMLRLDREGGLSRQQFEAFTRAYRATRTLSELEWGLIHSSYLYWQWRYGRKDRKSKNTGG